jgi:hypothetical protein
MYYYVGSLLSVEWTNQHECGSTSDKTNCDIILQYMCAPQNSDESVGVRDGTSEEQIRNNAGTYNLQDAAGGYLYGMHEDFAYYQRCSQRERNKGLFTADQGVSNNQGAQATRQNPNGGRSGFECPEERDYWPYWNPTPWKDIAVLTSRMNKCDFFTGESQNVRSKGNCSDPKFGQESLCRASGATFTQVNNFDIKNNRSMYQTPHTFQPFPNVVCNQNHTHTLITSNRFLLGACLHLNASQPHSLATIIWEMVLVVIQTCTTGPFPIHQPNGVSYAFVTTSPLQMGAPRITMICAHQIMATVPSNS